MASRYMFPLIRPTACDLGNGLPTNGFTQMPKRVRPQTTTRSEHWMRAAVGKPSTLNRRIREAFAWSSDDRIEWLSPVMSDQYAEYFDEAFLERLKVTDLRVPLHTFWPRSGPRGDGLARTGSGKVILVEAKAHIDECVDLGTRAKAESGQRI